MVVPSEHGRSGQLGQPPRRGAHPAILSQGGGGDRLRKSDPAKLPLGKDSLEDFTKFITPVIFDPKVDAKEYPERLVLRRVRPGC